MSDTSDTFIGDHYPEGIHEALGNVVVIWSNIEAALGEAILQVAYLQDYQAAHFLVAELNQKGRVSALRAICYTQMDTADYLIAEKWLAKIDGDLRNHRNRLIHDQWNKDILEMIRGDGGVSRRTVQAKIVKDPPSSTLRLQTSVETAVTAIDIIDLCADLDAARTAVIAISRYVKGGNFAETVPPISSRYKPA